jgi:hypothetical protein
MLETGEQRRSTSKAAAIEYAERLLAATLSELNRADAKGSIMLALTVGLTAGVVGGAVAAGWSPAQLTSWHLPLWWAGTVVLVGAMTLLTAAIYPRIRRRPAGGPDLIAYYGDVASYSDARELASALKRSTARDLDQLADQLLQVSRIVTRKYRLLAAGIWAVLVATVGCSSAVLLELL